MNKRPLGRTGLSIAPLVFGGNVFGWTADEATSFDLLDRFVDAGFNAIDTADSYSTWVPGNIGGESETIIGRWLKSRKARDKVVVFTKVGSEMGPGKKGLSAAYIEQAVEASLTRLGIDAIDLYQSHWPDPDTPYEETLGAYDRLLKAGKVRAIGASNLSADQLRAALDVSRKTGLPRYETLQPEYNLYDRPSYDGPLRDLCLSEGLGVICYFALARGFLSGKYRAPEDAAKSPRGESIASTYFNDRGWRILKALDDVAARHDAKPAEIALAWLIARPGVTAPIASATSADQLASLVRSARIELSAEDIAALDRASA